MSDVEIIQLGAYEPEGQRRVFDAVSYGHYYWAGMIQLEEEDNGGPWLCVFSDRTAILDDDYACRPGRVEELIDDELAELVIQKAVESCFDHTSAVEAIRDSDGNWITLETDT